jgi:Leucine-rich repeat (LRR) protein
MRFLEQFHQQLGSSRLSVSFFLPPHYSPLTALCMHPNFSCVVSPDTLYLDDNHFIGTLPLEISKLFALRYFDADGNTITGEIPLVFGELTSLRGLNLGRNKLTGSLPSGFNEQFSQLEYLILDQNKMIGSIEPSLWQMASLKTLDLHQNSFSGSLPIIVGADSLQVTAGALIFFLI